MGDQVTIGKLIDAAAEETRERLAALVSAAGPILAALKEAAPFWETEPDWNPDAHLEITVTVREARNLMVALGEPIGGGPGEEPWSAES